MTKQEEIREGIATYLKEHDGIICLRPRECDDVDCCGCQADGLISYLHSQGVVVKVDKEIPDAIKGCVKNAKKAGYSLTKPLIEG